MRALSSQEKFWAGEFGNDYTERNTLNQIVGPDTAMWADILSQCSAIPESAFEIGCNIGGNLWALKHLFPQIELSAVEINTIAAEQAAKNINATIHNCSIMDFDSSGKHFDLVFSCGVLIHINPDLLTKIYNKLYSISKKYILLSEYYSPTPVTIPYRNHSDKLFKRDFAGEMLNMFPELRLVAYKFIYHRDPIFPKDDCTWFLLEKNNPGEI